MRSHLPDESVPSYFLDAFGRPTRETACECERPREANLAQALHLLNSADLQTKIGSPKGRLAALLKDKQSRCRVDEELYLAVFGRKPSATELATVRVYVADQKNAKRASKMCFGRC